MVAKQPKRTLRTIIRELVDRTNTDTARIRLLEQEKDIVKSRMDSVEQNSAALKKQTDKAISDLTVRIEKTEKSTVQVESAVKGIIREMKKLAGTSKIKELETLIEMYNPIKSEFVTKEEAERMIERKIEETR